MATNSKAWDWNKTDDTIWLFPSEESYYLAERWKSKGYRTLLDLGCGLGRHSIFFTQRGFDVTGTDLSQQGVEHLDAWAARECLSVNTRICDMMELPFLDDSFDCVFSYHVISHTDTNGAVKIINEINRLLKPQGEFYITLCSKETWAWRDAGFPHIDENTVVKTCDGPENGVPHFHIEFDDLNELFRGNKIINVRHITDYFSVGETQNTTHFFILGEAKIY